MTQTRLLYPTFGWFLMSPWGNKGLEPPGLPFCWCHSPLSFLMTPFCSPWLLDILNRLKERQTRGLKMMAPHICNKKWVSWAAAMKTEYMETGALWCTDLPNPTALPTPSNSKYHQTRWWFRHGCAYANLILDSVSLKAEPKTGQLYR